MKAEPIKNCGCGGHASDKGNDDIALSQDDVRKTRTCVRCNDPTPRATLRVDGGVVCKKCYQKFYKAKKRCPLCGEMSRLVCRSPSKGFPDQEACEKCRMKKYAHCAGCDQFLYPVGTNADGKSLCKACFERGGKPFICPTCGKEGKFHSKKMCKECNWKRLTKKRFDAMVDQLTHDWSRKAFRKFYTRLIARQDLNRVACVTLNRYFQLFKQLDSVFDNPKKITEKYLVDTYGTEGLRRHSVSYGFMVREKIVPYIPNKVRADSTGLRYQRKLLDRAKGKWFETLMERYYQYRMKIHERYVRRGWGEKRQRFLQITISAELRAVLAFLNFVTDVQSLGSLQEMEQAHYEQFVKEHSGQKSALCAFLRYLNRKEKLFNKFTYKSIAAGLSEGTFLHSSKYLELIQLWLAPSDKTLKESLMCLLMVLYAQRPYRIVQIKMRDIAPGKDGAYRISLGQTEITLDHRIGNILGRYLRSRRALSLMEDTEDNEYLFPGRRYGHHIRPIELNKYLRRYGVKAPQLYATAIYNAYMSGLRHPKVLMMAFGISVATAIKYLNIIDPRLASEVNQKVAHV